MAQYFCIIRIVESFSALIRFLKDKFRIDISYYTRKKTEMQTQTAPE